MVAVLGLAAIFVVTGIAEAHGVSRKDATFVESIDGAAVGPFLYLGAKHMVTGHDGLRLDVDRQGQVRLPRGAAGAPKGYAESYQMDEGERAAGSFFAPTPGIHGWYWENQTSNEITLTLKSAGFYASAIEFTRDGQKTHELPER